MDQLLTIFSKYSWKLWKSYENKNCNIFL
jgi:hypothetical protein